MSASRRDFLRHGSLAGGGRSLCGSRSSPRRRPAPRAGAVRAEPVALGSAADGRVTLVVARSEMGQGVRTSLRDDPRRGARGGLDRGLDRAGLAVSRLRRHEHRRKRQRDLLLDAASPGGGGGAGDADRGRGARLEGGAAATAGRRRGPSSTRRAGRRLSYGALAPAAFGAARAGGAALKDPKDFRLVGTRVRRIDGPAIVTGRAKYGLDSRATGMLFAAVARCSRRGRKGRPASTIAKAKRVPGVRQVVSISTGVAVVAEDTWAALLRPRRAGGRLGRRAERLARRPPSSGAGSTKRPGSPATSRAGTATPRRRSRRRRRGSERRYRDPFQAHATVEPGNAVARVSGGRCEIWAPTQNPQRVQRESAKLLGIAPEKVTVHVTLLGGAFGRRLGADEATEAVEVANARAAARSRSSGRGRTTSSSDCLHPAGRVDVEAGLDASGRIVAWKQRYTSLPPLDVRRLRSRMPSIPPTSIPGGATTTPTRSRTCRRSGWTSSPRSRREPGAPSSIRRTSSRASASWTRSRTVSAGTPSTCGGSC